MKKQSLDPDAFHFWQAPEDTTLTTGAETEISIARLHLPIKIEDLPQTGAPNEKAIGDGIYEYLCRFPFCELAAEYAAILQRAYPFLISDIGSQLILLDVKDVAPEGLKRKIALLKILLYLEPDNFGLLHKLGKANFDLGINYAELAKVKFQLKEARTWLERARRIQANDLNNLNLLGQVCYLNGSYHQAKLYWKIAVDQLQDGKGKVELTSKLDKLNAGQLPEKPLVESLETVGAALEHIRLEEYGAAVVLLERLELIGDLTRELPNAEFFYLLGLSREHTEDHSGAFEAYSTALKLDQHHQSTLDALKRIHSASA